jgi:CheY-specific phosphatase CheX
VKIIRKILILSINTDWANDLKDQFLQNKKVSVEIATTRTVATKYLTDLEFDAVVMEDTFKLKNMDYFLRSLSSQKHKPKFVFFLFSEFNLFQSLAIPEELSSIQFRAHSLPMPKEMIEEVVSNELFPRGATSDTSLDREFMQVLIKSTHRVLETLSIENLTAKKPELLSKMDDPTVAIRGKIILKTDFFNGSLLLSFPEASYKQLYSKVVGQEIETLNDENKDFAGELANMVYGQTKKHLEENGVKLDMAIPIIDQSPKLNSSKPIYVIPFESSIGNFYIKLAPDLF